jgi:hypothetical protein
MAYTFPAISDFKSQFVRDFPYGGAAGDPNKSILDGDINVALTLAGYNINQGLWPDQTSFNLSFLYLSAHYLVLNIRNSSQGLNGQFNWAQNSKAAGPVSEAFTIPQRVIDNPELMMLTKTNYGAMYLQLALPQLVGNVFTVCGRTKP